MSPIVEHPAFDAAEELLTSTMVPARRREFLAGRVLARRAIARLGGSDLAIGRGALREPIWPDGFTGSISHTGGACLVVVARRVEYTSVGIDLEEASPLEEALWESVCTESELAELAAQPLQLRGLYAKRLFSAKEAYYKFQFPLTGAFLEFTDVGVQFEHESGTFLATLLKASDMPATALRASGRFVEFDGTFGCLVSG